MFKRGKEIIKGDHETIIKKAAYDIKKYIAKL